MIEQAIYFALGCIVTALLALLFAPVFWSRALRLTRKRLQLQVPLSMQEILAERDHLRAAHAVAILRVEQAMEQVRATKNADMVAIGRHSIEAARLAEEVEAFRRLEEAQAKEIALLREAVAAHEVEGAALRKNLASAHTDVETLRGEAEASAREHSRLSEEGEGHRASAAALLARIADHDALQATVRRLEADLTVLRGERDDERERQKSFHLGNSLKAEKERAADKITLERVDRLEKENDALRRALETRDPTADEEAQDAGLRASIHALGLAVASMSRERGGRVDRETGPGGA